MIFAGAGETSYSCCGEKAKFYLEKLRKPGAESSRAFFLEKEKHNQAARGGF